MKPPTDPEVAGGATQVRPRPAWKDLPKKKATHPGMLVNRFQAAKILGLSKQRIEQMERDSDYPPPFCILEDAQGREARVFERAAIERYARRRGVV